MNRYSKKQIFLIALGHIGGAAAVAGIIFLLTKIFGEACPTYAFFKICCPFCGMTRAHIAALRLDLASAVSYNPAFPFALPALFLMAHEKLFPMKAQKAVRITAYTLFGAIVAVYIVRVCLYGFDFFD